MGAKCGVYVEFMSPYFTKERLTIYTYINLKKQLVYCICLHKAKILKSIENGAVVAGRAIVISGKTPYINLHTRSILKAKLVT